MSTKKRAKRAKSKKRLLFIVTVILAVFLAGKLFLDFVYVPVIIMYHSVGEKNTALDGYSEKLNVLPATFAKQMKFLRDRNYNVITLEEFIERMKRGERIPARTIAITLDDGLRNNFFYAYPALKKHNLPATIFVATDFVGKQDFLTWSDMKTMQEGGISIGSHTLSHCWLPSLPAGGIREELVKSKEILEKQTGRKIKTLSYPLGAFNEEVRKIAEETGYIGAVATNPGPDYPDNDPYALKRIRISMTSDNLVAFWIETSGYYTFIKEIRDED